MHTIVLAAGFGGRMGDYARDIPKALIPFGRGTILDKVITEVWINEMTCIHIPHNAKSGALFKRWKQSIRWMPPPGKKWQAPYVRTYNTGARKVAERRGAVGDLAFVLERLGQRFGVLIVCADNFFKFTSASLKALQGETSAITVRNKSQLREAVLEGEPSRVRVVAGKVLEITDYQPERPTPWRFCGPSYLSSNGIKYLLEYVSFCKQAEMLPDSIGAFFDWLREKEEVRVVREDGKHFFDLGTKRGYLDTVKAFKLNAQRRVL